MAGVRTGLAKLVAACLPGVLLAAAPWQAAALAPGLSQQRSTASASSAAPAANADHAGQVWVNTKTKVYHPLTSKWAGNTKQGKWMTEAEAQRAGYRKAMNE